MKRKGLILAIVLLISGGALSAQEYYGKRGLPGDNLNLYAVLKAFQESPTLEEFENRLNSPDELINNLDLNSDGRVDYIQVIDYPFGDETHDIVLRIAINRRENQDVAVIHVKRDRYDGVTIQITGDPYLYGDNYIVEPNYYDNDRGTPNPGYAGGQISYGGTNVSVTFTTVREVYGWPIVRFIFAPNYYRWISPWHWNFYPPQWRPWSPYYWDYYYGYHYNWMRHYLRHYRVWHSYRDPHWFDRYKDNRYVSRVVVTKRDRGEYNRTYSRPDTRDMGMQRYRSDVERRRGDNDRFDTRNGSRDAQATINPENNRANRGGVRPQQTNEKREPAYKYEVVRSRTNNQESDVRRSEPANRESEVRKSEPVKTKESTTRSESRSRNSDVKRTESKVKEVKSSESKRSESSKSESTQGRRSRTR